MSLLKRVTIKNWPISYQIIGLSVAITLICVTSVGYLATKSVTKSIKSISGKDMAAVLHERKLRLHEGLISYESSLHVMALNHATVQDMISFSEGFHSIIEDLSAAGVASPADHSAMDRYLDNEFAARLTENGLRSRGVSAYTPKLDDAKAAQRMYIANNTSKVGSKHELAQAKEAIAYNEVHGTYHEHYKTFVKDLGLYDLFMIDPDGNVVYSVFKETDYATNVVNGPFAGSGLSKAFSQAKSMKKGDIALVDYSNYEPSYGAPAWFCSSPLYEENELVGVLVYQVPTDAVNTIIGEPFGDTGQSYIIGSDRKLRSNIPNEPERAVFDEVIESEAIDAALSGNTEPIFSHNLHGDKVLTLSEPIDFGPFTWYLIGTIDYAEVVAPAHAISKSIIVEGLIIAGLMIPVGLFFARSLSRPIGQIVEVMHKMSKGDLTARIALERGDELGQLTTSVNSMAEELSGVMNEVQMSSNEVASAATQIAASAVQMTQGMEEQRRQTSQVSAAVEEMSSSVQEVAQGSNELSIRSEESGNKAREGGRIVQQTVDGMSAISDQVNQSVQAVGELGGLSEKIGDIVAVINDIADQTNLLALNAAIEAARAGEHGRGFAVVADEVRKLAERTMNATGEVADSVRAIQQGTESAIEFMESGKHKVDDGVQLAQSAGSALEEIVSSAAAITPMIQGIAAAANQQAAAANEIAENVIRIDGVTNQSVDAVHEVSKAANTLSEKSESLLQLIRRFDIGHR